MIRGYYVSNLLEIFVTWGFQENLKVFAQHFSISNPSNNTTIKKLQKMIIQVEHPKSGGTWVYKMLTYYLNIPVLPLLRSKSGIPNPGIIEDPDMARKEGCDGKNPFSSQAQFEYVSQSHALPNNYFFSPKHCTYYLLRDGRDVVVSYYFYEFQYLDQYKKQLSISKFLKNLIIVYLSIIFPKIRPYSRYINLSNHSSLFDKYVAIRAKEWRYHVESWLKLNKPYFKYEDFLQNTHGTFIKILDHIGAEIDHDLLCNTVESMSFDNCKKLENDSQIAKFYRKGIHGDWKNHFNNKQKEIFKKLAGDTLIKLGYKKDLYW